MRKTTLSVSLALFFSTSLFAATPPDTLIVVQSLDDIISLDPAESNELSSIQTVPSLYQRIVQPSRDNPEQLDAILLEGWQADPAKKTLSIRIKENAQFASGNPVRPEDIIFSYRRAVIMNKSPAFILNTLGWNKDNITEQFEKTGNHTLKIKWSANISPDLVLNLLSTPIASIIDEKLVTPNIKNNDFGNTWLKMHSAGSGAYFLKIYQPNQAIVMVANPYVSTDKAKIESVIIKNVPDPASRRLLIQQGDADIARELGADQTVALKNTNGIRVEKIPSAKQDFLVFNTGNSENLLLKNPALWEASRYLVDYEGIVKNLLKDQYFIHQNFLPVGLPGSLTNNPYKFDPNKAKAILEKAGIKDVYFTLDVENKQPYITIAQSLQASFAQGGIRVELLPAAGSQVYSRVRTRSHQAAIRFWIPDYFDAHSNASTFAFNDGKIRTIAWLNGWNIPALSKITQRAVAEPDKTKRIQMYTAMQEELQRISPYVFMFQGQNQVVLRDNVKGYQQGLNADMVYYDRVTK